MSEREQQLLELKRRILEKKNKNNDVLSELQSLNKAFIDLKEVISNSKNASDVKENLDFAKRFDKVSSKLEYLVLSMAELSKKEASAPRVIVPNKFFVTNIDKAKPDKVKIDWENAPDKSIDLSPIKILQKSVESILVSFVSKINGFIISVNEYMSQPDRIVVTDNNITEYYGSRKIVYSIKDDGVRREVKLET